MQNNGTCNLLTYWQRMGNVEACVLSFASADAGFRFDGASSKALATIGAFPSPAAKIMAVASGLKVIVCSPIVIISLFLDISIPPKSPAAAA